MKTMIVWFTTTMALLASPAHAEDGAPAVPQFAVDAFWPKPLPNKWILGQVSGIATDRYDRIWVVHRPASLTLRERAAEQSPPRLLVPVPSQSRLEKAGQPEPSPH